MDMSRDRKLIDRIKDLYSYLLETAPGCYIYYKAWMSDRRYVEEEFRERFGKYPDLDDPKTFNEKNCWRKLWDRRPVYTRMVDKYYLKKLVEKRCGPGHTFRLLGVWKDPGDIDLDSLPEQFVLKPNHSGGVIICRDKKNFDLKKAVRELRWELRRDGYLPSREWPYKNVPRRIIAEEYRGEGLIDYKNYCFDGRVMYTLVWQNFPREDGTKPEARFCGAYDREWKRTDMELGYPSEDIVAERPEGYEKMIEIAERMSKGIPFVRADLYIQDGEPYLGEMTFFPWGGYQIFKGEKWNRLLGEMEKLPEPYAEGKRHGRK